MQTDFSDGHLVKAIAAGGHEMEVAMRYVYEQETYQLAITKFVLSNGGIAQDAEDVFQDGIAHLVINIRKGNFRGESTLKTYLISICRRLWFRKIGRSSHLENIKKDIQTERKEKVTPESIYIHEEQKKRLGNWLDKLGSPCREILSMWSLSYSMQEIAKKTGYKNEGVVRKKKFQCMKSLMKLAAASHNK